MDKLNKPIKRPFEKGKATTLNGMVEEFLQTGRNEMWDAFNPYHEQEKKEWEEQRDDLYKVLELNGIKFTASTTAHVNDKG